MQLQMLDALLILYSSASTIVIMQECASSDSVTTPDLLIQKVQLDKNWSAGMWQD
jgi:hypothetical protein